MDGWIDRYIDTNKQHNYTCSINTLKKIPGNLPYIWVALRPLQNGFFIGHFVVTPLSEKVQIPLQRMQTMSFCRENKESHG